MTPTARRATTLAAVSAVALSAFVLQAPAHAAEAGPTCDDTTCRYVVDPDAGRTTFEVPAGVTRIAVELAGAPGPANGDTPGGRGGVLRTELDVAPGIVLTAQHPQQSRSWKPEPPVPGESRTREPLPPRLSNEDLLAVAGRGDLAALFVGEGTDARPVAVAGGGGASGNDGVGGVGGGWDPDPSRLLRGGDGVGPGAGYGATPDGPGGVQADGAQVAGDPGDGPLTAPGTRGFGGRGNLLTWHEDETVITENDVVIIPWKKMASAPGGGNGWYGGGAASHHHTPVRTGGGGGGSGYLAPGLVATEPSATTYEAATTTGTVVLEWSPVPAQPVVLEPVVLDASGTPVSGPLTSRDVTVTASGLPAGAAFTVRTELPGYPGWARVEQDGTARVAYTLPVDASGTVRLLVDVAVDDVVVASAGVDVQLAAEPGATPGATPAPTAPGAVAGSTTPTPAATASAAAERSDVLAATGSPRSGVLAATGAQVTVLGLVAVALLLGGAALFRWRRQQTR